MDFHPDQIQRVRLHWVPLEQDCPLIRNYHRLYLTL